MNNMDVEKYGYQLVESLEDLIKNYRQLLDLVRKEKNILISANIDDLNNLNLSKDEMIISIRQSDAIRIKCVAQVAESLGLSQDNIRLLDLANRTQGELSQRLRTQHATLDILIKRLSELNKQNAQYAESALRNINGAINNIKETVSGKSTYQNKGKYNKNTEAAGYLVSKEA